MLGTNVTRATEKEDAETLFTELLRRTTEVKQFCGTNFAFRYDEDDIEACQILIFQSNTIAKCMYLDIVEEIIWRKRIQC